MNGDAPDRKMAKAEVEAFFLAGIGGCVDAIGVLTLGGLFVSHMSGNTAALGAAFGQGDWRVGLPHLFAVPVFVLGLFFGYVAIVRHPTYRRCAVILLAEAILLLGFAVLQFVQGEPIPRTAAFYIQASLPLLAMGMQNATLRQVGRSVFPTTYVTGVLDALGHAAAQVFLCWGTREAKDERRIAWEAAGMWSAYVGGALLGGFGLLTLKTTMVLVPVAVLVLLAAHFHSAGGKLTNQPRSAPGS